jgi:trehalose 6-phosphate synthase
MRLTHRLSLSLTLGVALVSLAIAFYQTRAETRGLEQDLDHHSLVLAESLERSAEPLVEGHSFRELERLVNRFQDKQQIAGVGIYDHKAAALATSPGVVSRLAALPEPIILALQDGNAHAGFIRNAEPPLHVAVLPLRTNAVVIGALGIFHDASYIERQTSALWRRALIGVAVQTLLIVSITLLMLRWGFAQPMHRMAHWLSELRAGRSAAGPGISEFGGDFGQLSKEVTHLASSLTAARAVAEEEARLRYTSESLWTNDRLRLFVRERLGDSRVFVVSNREPYEHFHGPKGIECAMPASGLVTALEPILRACNGTWIAQGTGDADRETVDRSNRVQVPPDQPQYTLRRVWLNQAEEEGFYLGFSNEGLWPLCHIAHTRPVFRAEDWERYSAVNAKFAEVILDEIAGETNPVILVQDYHFTLLPRLIKARRPDARVAIFWHIPWPNPEAFGICPWQRQLLDGLLAADLIGFHIQAHCNNFLNTVDRALESRIEWERFAVSRRGHRTFVRPFPISVATDRPSGDAPPPDLPHLERCELLAKLGVRASHMGIGVDRIDYTKGLIERFRGIEAFLDQFPNYRRDFTFVQIGAPSRTEIKRYHDLMDEVRSEVDRINQRFQTPDWKPIVLLTRRHSHREILPYYQTADFCLVTSLHDGMNLVAKEFVASREDEHGALILSRFAGASHELVDALVINPYDTGEMARAIHAAIEMAPEEMRMRMQRMRAVVRERNIYRWAGELIDELCGIRTASVSTSGPRLVIKAATTA